MARKQAAVKNLTRIHMVALGSRRFKGELGPRDRLISEAKGGIYVGELNCGLVYYKRNPTVRFLPRVR